MLVALAPTAGRRGRGEHVEISTGRLRSSHGWLRQGGPWGRKGGLGPGVWEELLLRDAMGETVQSRLEHLELLCLLSRLSDVQRRKPADPNHTANRDTVNTTLFSRLIVQSHCLPCCQGKVVHTHTQLYIHT